LEVSQHLSVDHVAEVAFEDAHRFLVGVAGVASVGVELAGSWLAAQLGDGHAVQGSADAPVAGWVVAVRDGLAAAFA